MGCTIGMLSIVCPVPWNIEVGLVGKVGLGYEHYVDFVDIQECSNFLAVLSETVGIPEYYLVGVSHLDLVRLLITVDSKFNMVLRRSVCLVRIALNSLKECPMIFASSGHSSAFCLYEGFVFVVSA